MANRKLKDFRERIPGDCVPYKTPKGLALIPDLDFRRKFLVDATDAWGDPCVREKGTFVLTDESYSEVERRAPRRAAGFIIGHFYSFVDDLDGRSRHLFPVLYARKKKGRIKNVN